MFPSEKQEPRKPRKPRKTKKNKKNKKTHDIFEKEIVKGPQKKCSQVKNKNLENLET